MFSNPVTSIIGVIVALCPIIGSYFPGVKELCDMLMGEFIGLGFITASDGIRLPRISPPIVKSFLLALTFSLIGSTLVTGCAGLLQTKAQMETIFAATVSGTYTVEVQKDGQVLYRESWECTSDGTKLTGCHKVAASLMPAPLPAP